MACRGSFEDTREQQVVRQEVRFNSNMTHKTGYADVLHSGPEHHFKDWHVAFTVDLKLVNGHDHDRLLVLDFSSA